MKLNLPGYAAFMLFLVGAPPSAFGAPSGDASATLSAKFAPSLIWRQTIPGKGASLTVQDNVVYAAEETSVAAIERVSGKLLWRHDFADRLPLIPRTGQRINKPYTTFTPVVHQAMALVTVSSGAAGHILAVNPATGDVLWDRDMSSTTAADSTHGPIVSQPVVFHDLAVFRTGKGVEAVKLSDGSAVWNVPMDPRGAVPLSLSAQPARDDRAVYFNADFGLAYAFDGRTGGALWERQTKGIDVGASAHTRNIHITFAFCQPLLVGDKLFVADGLGNIYALRPEDGGVQWQINSGYVFDFASIGASRVYAATFNGFFEIDANSGTVLRSYPKKLGFPHFALAGDKAILADFPVGWKIFDITHWTPMAAMSDLSVRDIAVAGGAAYVMGHMPDTPDNTEIRAYKL